MAILPTPDLLIPFLATVALTELTPGPNMGYLAIVAGRWGLGAGLATVAGVTLGLAGYLAAAVFGMAQLVVQTDWLFETLRWLGVLYLLWLAYDSWRGPEAVVTGAAPAAPGAGRLIARGFVANVLNPKAALFYAVLLPGFTQIERGAAPLQMLTLGGIHLAVATTVHLTIVLAASGLSPAASRWKDGEAGQAARRAMAVGLALVAAWMAWETRRAEAAAG